MDNHFTHVDAAGNARMVDVGEKAVTHRTAVAVGRVTMSPECFAAVAEGRAKKGDVLGVAQVAGIMATKRTSDLIPLCHTLLLTKSAVDSPSTRRSTASRRSAPSGARARPAWRWRP